MLLSPLIELNRDLWNQGKPNSYLEEYRKVSLVDFDFDNFSKQLFDTENQEEYKHPFGKLIKKLWPGCVKEQLRNMNTYVKI